MKEIVKKLLSYSKKFTKFHVNFEIELPLVSYALLFFKDSLITSIYCLGRQFNATFLYPVAKGDFYIPLLTL